MGLGRYRILVGENRSGCRIGRVWIGGAGVDGGHHRAIILVLVEVGVCNGVCLVQWVLKRWIERTKRQLVDDVREIED